MTAASRVVLPDRPRILVIALRRLGDVLLATPLIRSLRRAWPDAVIDSLVFAETAGILAGNPDLDNVVVMPDRPTVAQSAALALRLWRAYDLAVATQPGDRPTLFAIIAGRRSVAPIEDGWNGSIKRALLSRSVPDVQGLHRVEAMLRLADALGVARLDEVVSPSALPVDAMPAGDYAVIHAAPKFRYKQWGKSGWRELAAWLADHGLLVIATGSPSESERHYLDEIWDRMPVRRLEARLNWQQLSALLAKARVFIGPDTSVTHLAAASGCPTVALFGPTDPRLWGPWPRGGMNEIWAASGTTQRRGNVWLLQHGFPCTPCQLEGCERRLESHSQCLDELSPRQVIAAVDEALAAQR